MAVLTPHFDLPFRFGGYVEQGTTRDLVNCVFMIVSTPLGWRDEVPSFGIPNLAFDNLPVMKEQIKTAIMEQEPRATILFSERFGLNELERVVNAAVDDRRAVGF